MKFGEPFPKRQQTIADLQSAKGRRPHYLEFKGKEHEFQVYSVPVDFPKYRLNNGRTLAAQEAWLAQHPELPADLFSKDLESEQAQEEQHKILLTMVDDEGLFSHFKENEQKEPLLLSSFGFVVNGNRRLCAMRDLYETDKTKYQRFAHIEIIILPPAEDKDLYELEAGLQVRPDIQSRYAWHQQAKMLKRGRGVHGFSDDELARINGMKPERVRELIQLLETADKYLVERNTPHRYDKVERAEFAFRKLREGKERFKDEGDRAVFEKLAYIMIDNPEASNGRLYQAIPAVTEHYDAIVQRIKQEVELEAAPAIDPTIALLGGANDDASLALALTVKKSENHGAILDIMADVVEAEKAKARVQKNADYPLRRVKDANAALAEAHNTLESKSSTAGMRDQLDAIESNVKRVRAWLDKHA